MRSFAFSRSGLLSLTGVAVVLGAAAAVVLGLGGLSAAGATAGAQSANRATAAQNADPLVQTDKGPVRGFVKNGVTEFLGIPYAAPPVGALRWRPPQPPASWTQPLNATHYAPACAQVVTDAVFSNPSTSENCLYLNIFTPRVGRSRSGGLPVLVWLHGGGQDGSSHGYDGSKLALGGRYGGSDTVVVTVEFRLGVFGFFALPALDNESHTANYAIMDQQAALRWVQRNISAFGGDPHRVTLAGQSAGATDTGANVISPMSAGLFDRAIFESDPLSSLVPLSTSLSRGEAFARAAGCPGDDAATAACLRKLTVPQILQLAGTANNDGPYYSTSGIVDGTVIPVTPEEAWTTGRFNHMPMMGGNVKDEGNWTIGKTEYFSGSNTDARVPVTAASYKSFVTSTYAPPAYPSGTAAKVLAEYPLSNYATPQLAEDAVGTDPTACENRHVDNLLSERVPYYAYEFDYQHAPFYFPTMPGFVPLADHTIDIQFLFPGWHGGTLGVSHPLNAQETTLSNELVAAWTNFAATGNPNRTGNQPWPQFRSGAGPYLSENIPTLSTMSDPQFSAEHRCDFWDPILGL